MLDLVVYTAPSGSRNLLRRINSIMQEKIAAEERLQKIVVMVAQTMVAEVCSIYVIAQDSNLVLVATEGLRKEAIGKAVLKIGEGIIGTIAKEGSAKSVPDAKTHPNFKLLPKIGEEVYHSLLGVPILRMGETLGVLAVQNQMRQDYRDEDVEALEIIAMVISDLIANELRNNPNEKIVAGSDPLFTRYVALEGRKITEGLALGHAVLHQPRISIKTRLSEDIDYELERLSNAVESMREDIDLLVKKAKNKFDDESADILETVRMFAHDLGWVKRMQEAVKNGITAESAVEQVYSDARARLLRQPNPILAEKLHDIEDISNRMLRYLMGIHHDPLSRTDLPENPILVARNLAPTELLDYFSHNLRGLVIENGALGSHIAIVARALGLVTICQAKGIADQVNDGDAIILDGYKGDVHLRPEEQVVESYAQRVKMLASTRKKYREMAHLPTTSKDGIDISIMANAGLLVDLSYLSETHAKGIGLFRTEFQFMLSPSFPRLEDLVSSYQTIFDIVGDLPIYFRTLDVGGDKQLTYLKFKKEENPALGLRAIRHALKHPTLFRQQIRALIRAADGKTLHLMFPMIANLDEFFEAKNFVKRQIEWLQSQGYDIPQIKYGTMLEVPSLLFSLESLCQNVDFISIGPNDLMQFFFAADRGNVDLEGKYDILSPAPLRAIHKIIEVSKRYKVDLSICGEASTEPENLVALLGLGMRKISLPIHSIGAAQWIIRSVNISKAENIINDALFSCPIDGVEMSSEQLRKNLKELLPSEI